MTANSYKDVTTLVTTLNWMSALRNYTSFKKNKCRFLCSWLYDIVLICAVSCVTLTFETHNLKYLPYNIERIVYTFMMLAHVVGIFWITVLGLHHSKDMLALMKHFDKVDENLKKLGCKADYRVLHRHVLIIGALLIVTLLGTIVTFARHSVMDNLQWTSIVANTSFICGTNVGSVVFYEFKIGVYWLGLRFKETNELLRTFLLEGHQIKNDEPSEETNAKKNGKFHQQFRLGRWLSDYSIHPIRVHPVNNVPSLKQESQSIKKVHLLQQIRFAHLQLCRTSKMLNQTFNAQLLSYATIILIYITVLLYYLYMEYHRRLYPTSNLNFVIFYTLDIFSNCLKIGVVSYGCEYTTHEANKAIEIIHACSVYQIDTELKDEILQFCLQISHMQLGKSKSAFFRLNYGFIRDCISFVSTYLIIIIQWSQNLQPGDPPVLPNGTEVTRPEDFSQRLNVQD